MLKTAILAASIGLFAGSPVLAQVGNAAMPIVVKMKRGTDSITLHGVMRQNGACCTYLIGARAGQKLYWSETGAVVRMVITYPNGDSDGPGLPNPQPLPATGVYGLAISPDLMADGAFGPYTLRIRIPPN
jgi:hypothetical protein